MELSDSYYIDTASSVSVDHEKKSVTLVIQPGATWTFIQDAEGYWLRDGRLDPSVQHSVDRAFLGEEPPLRNPQRKAI